MIVVGSLSSSVADVHMMNIYATQYMTWQSLVFTVSAYRDTLEGIEVKLDPTRSNARVL